MAPHSSTLAWKITWAEEPGRLQSMGSLRVRHDWATSLSLFTFMHWRRKWQTHSSVLAWRIPGTGEPGGLPSMGSHRVGHDWVTSLSLFTFMHWRRKWQTHSSILAWRIPGTGEPGWAHRVRHNWSDLAAASWVLIRLSEHFVFRVPFS